MIADLVVLDRQFHTQPSAERSSELISHLRLYVNEEAALVDGLRGPP